MDRMFKNRAGLRQLLRRGRHGQAELRSAMLLLHIPWDTAIEKRSVLYEIGRQCYRSQRIPVICSLLSEAWSASPLSASWR
jgi:hypothetical protein